MLGRRDRSVGVVYNARSLGLATTLHVLVANADLLFGNDRDFGTVESLISLYPKALDAHQNYAFIVG